MGRDSTLLASIPSVDRLLHLPEAGSLLAAHGRPLVVEELRAALDGLRRAIRDAAGDPGVLASLARRLEPPTILAEVDLRLTELLRPRLRKVLNATGVVLHTGLGRAVLPPAALQAIRAELDGYAYLEVDPATGERGERELWVRDLLVRLTGAESATVVNNNAAATLIALAAVARGKEVVVSRGQLVEIGGSFRIPDVMAESGARLVEVGTTNRTRLADYERAIGPETGALMLVHPSNYRVVGFTEEVDRADLVRLATSRGLPVLEDLGSGALVDFGPFGLPDEPTVRDVLAAGVALATASGDKLLGGPQCGLVVGRADLVARVRRHPLYRAFRCDKMTFAALEATLKTYLVPGELARDNPTYRMLTEPAEALRPRAEAIARDLAALPGLLTEARPDVSRPGSGSLPTVEIPTWVAAVTSRTLPAHDLARRLRLARPAVVSRTKDDVLLLDPRTLLPGEDDELVAVFRRVVLESSPAE